MFTLLIVSLATLFVWETFSSLSPWSPPEWLSALIVLSVAGALSWPDWRIALAAAGTVSFGHLALRKLQGSTSPLDVSRLRGGIGQRVPNIP